MYYRGRYYDVLLSLFTTRDPLGYAAGDVNLYRYVGNAPIVRIDPMGLEPISGVASSWEQPWSGTSYQSAYPWYYYRDPDGWGRPVWEARYCVAVQNEAHLIEFDLPRPQSAWLKVDELRRGIPQGLAGPSSHSPRGFGPYSGPPAMYQPWVQRDEVYGLPAVRRFLTEATRALTREYLSAEPDRIVPMDRPFIGGAASQWPGSISPARFGETGVTFDRPSARFGGTSVELLIPFKHQPIIGRGPAHQGTIRIIPVYPLRFPSDIPGNMDDLMDLFRETFRETQPRLDFRLEIGF